VALMDAGRKCDALDEWLRYDLPEPFKYRIIPVEGLIAATDVAHQLTLATRNAKDSKASE